MTAGALIGKLRQLAPYAAMELILPGGSVIALLLWFYRRQTEAFAIPTLRFCPSCEGAVAPSIRESRSCRFNGLKILLM
jgi:hypothetical protein